MVDTCTVSFPGTAFAPLVLPPHTPLADRLTLQNSPVLFGCRTGLCGTCAVKVRGAFAPADAEELEVLAAVVPDEPEARLACQLDLIGDIEIRSL